MSNTAQGKAADLVAAMHTLTVCFHDDGEAYIANPSWQPHIDAAIPIFERLAKLEAECEDLRAQLDEIAWGDAGPGPE